MGSTRQLDAFVTIGKQARLPIERLLSCASLVPTTPFLDPHLFPWTQELEHHWLELRRELDDVLDSSRPIPSFQEISVRQSALTTDHGWKTFFFFGYGLKADTNCARCPKTAALLESIPGLRTAFFSILAPGKELPPHRGPYKGVLRYHLALRIPNPPTSCGIRVGETQRHWEEGHSLLFDDSFEHEAWNHGNSVRVVLFIDIERPLKPPVNQLNRGVLTLIASSPYVQHAKRQFLAWEQNAALHNTAESSR